MSEKKRTRGARTNIFAKYFLIFASVFLVALVALGSTLIFLVNSYERDEKTQLLKENTSRIAEGISNVLIINDMNRLYSGEKAAICTTLSTVSKCISCDIYVCDVEGSVIICKDQTEKKAYRDNSMVCNEHEKFRVDDALLLRIYEDGTAFKKAVINGKSCYVVGTKIVAPEYSQGSKEGANGIIGIVFATVEDGVSELVESLIKTFLIVGVAVLIIAFLLIWLITKRMVTPLQQMSAAAKSFAVGDFSYRVKVKSNDELADLGNAFNDMAEALDKLESSRRSFVANVSHELKTPMTSIAGFIDGMLDGTIPPEKQDYYLKIVSDEIRRLSRLVVAMLNMSKMESGDFEMKRKSYNISDQIIHILLTFEQKIDEKNIEILGLDNMEPHRVYADPDMIYQVIYNLFDNAVKFTNEGGYIKIDVNESGSKIRVSIKNSGEGIAANELSKIFERFYKVDKSRSLDAKGAGLGLYIVKMMIEMHGGKIVARSPEKDVAEFIFTLPKSENG